MAARSGLEANNFTLAAKYPKRHIMLQSSRYQLDGDHVAHDDGDYHWDVFDGGFTLFHDMLWNSHDVHKLVRTNECIP